MVSRAAVRLHPADRHLIAVEGAKASETLFLLGTDTHGRDLWSRLMYATRTSMTIGLVSVALSLVLGVILGGVSGYFGGTIDTVIQRVIEILRSIPTIPLWMGLAAALPSDWSVVQMYFAITIIISLIGWTELARVVRGRFISLKQEDFVMAAELVGCSKARIIFRHMVPSFVSHIIAATTLAIPAIIISETSLSFLGLGLRPPAISWGVLLQDAQNIQALGHFAVAALSGGGRHRRGAGLQLHGRRNTRRGRSLPLTMEDTKPLLSVRNLRTSFFRTRERPRPSTALRSTFHPARRLHRRRERVRQERDRAIDPADR
jgi:ABC-type dipeptide/oligopeptide/nickel transport system permease subunit